MLGSLSDFLVSIARLHFPYVGGGPEALQIAGGCPDDLVMLSNDEWCQRTPEQEPRNVPLLA